jgi:hypothetical protein
MLSEVGRFCAKRSRSIRGHAASGFADKQSESFDRASDLSRSDYCTYNIGHLTCVYDLTEVSYRFARFCTMIVS